MLACRQTAASDAHAAASKTCPPASEAGDCVRRGTRKGHFRSWISHSNRACVDVPFVYHRTGLMKTSIFTDIFLSTLGTPLSLVSPTLNPSSISRPRSFSTPLDCARNVHLRTAPTHISVSWTQRAYLRHGARGPSDVARGTRDQAVLEHPNPSTPTRRAESLSSAVLSRSHPPTQPQASQHGRASRTAGRCQEWPHFRTHPLMASERPHTE